jgi:hypothetical protein
MLNSGPTARVIKAQAIGLGNRGSTKARAEGPLYSVLNSIAYATKWFSRSHFSP